MKKSFTLIEMLIVIVIIGILAAALVPRLQDVQARARDTKRKADITQINNALLIYNTDYGKYPQSANASGTCALNVNCYRFSYDNTMWITHISGYMTSIPQDPINNGINARNTTGVFSYAYGNIWLQQKTYILVGKLENTNDPDRCELQGYKYYLGYISTCQILYPTLYVRSDTAGN